MVALLTFIAEDSNVILESLSETLEETAGVCMVGSSATAEGAIAWLTGHRSDWQLAIIDLVLVGGTGLEVLRECRSRASTQGAIVLTNYATPDIRRACADLGADAVFDKSTEIDELIGYCANFTRRGD